MQDHAGGVDDASQLRRGHGPKSRGDRSRTLGAVAGRTAAFSRDLISNCVYHALVAVLADELGVGGLVDERPYTRQGCSPMNPLIAYPSHSPNEIRLAGV